MEACEWEGPLTSILVPKGLETRNENSRTPQSRKPDSEGQEQERTRCYIDYQLRLYSYAKRSGIDSRR